MPALIDGAETGVPRAAASKWLLALLVATLGVVAVVTEIGELHRVATRKTDFGTFYHAAWEVRRDADPYLGTEYLYPPTFAYALLPLTWLPVVAACLLWFALKSVLVVLSLRLCYRGLEGERLDEPKRGWFAIGLLLVACRFWMTDLRGNSNVVVLFFSLAALWAVERMRDGRAGWWLAAAASIKLVPGVIAGWFLARRRARALLVFVLGFLVLNLAPFAFRPGAAARQWSSYLPHGVEQRLDSRLAEPDNQSLRGALARALPASGRVVTWIWAVGAVALAAWVVAAIARLGLTSRRERFAAAGCFFLLELLISPGSWVVHYTAALLPLGAALRLVLDRGRLGTMLVAAFAAANLVYSLSGLSRASVRWAADGSLFVIATALLLGALLWELRRRDRISAPPLPEPR